MSQTKPKICYSIQESKGKSYFTRIGVAFVNRDGSLNVILNCLPVDGKIHIRDQQEYEPNGRNESGRDEVENESIRDDNQFPF